VNITVIGSGNIGRTLAARWRDAGHSVSIGVRDPHSPKAEAAARELGPQVAVRPLPAALAGAEAVLLALPGAAVEQFAREHGAALAGGLVIDATNQFGQPVMNGLAALAQYAPGARLARAFNSLGWENFAQPEIDGVQVDLLYCAEDGAAQAGVERLIADCGLRPIRVGGLEQAPLVDAIGALWGALVFGQGLGRRLAFKVQLPAT
jgi:predicted dinucleotide-binding enzyme